MPYPLGDKEKWERKGQRDVKRDSGKTKRGGEEGTQGQGCAKDTAHKVRTDYL